MKLDDILKAAELHRRGYETSEIAKEIGYSRSSVVRAKASRPDLFEEHDPGSLEHRRSILLRALETGNLSEQLRAVELLERLGANEKPQGSQRIYVEVTGPTYCPACHAYLGDDNETVVHKGDKPPSVEPVVGEENE